jgi:hypothetical protein
MQVDDVYSLLNCPASDRNIPVGRHCDGHCQFIEDFSLLGCDAM